MAWTVIVAKPAEKQVAKFPVKDQTRIGIAVRSMAVDPFGGDVRKLEGERDRWRRRIGNYRIFFRIDSDAKTVYISAMERRTSTTY